MTVSRRTAAAAVLTAGAAARAAVQPGGRVQWPTVKLLDGRSWSAAEAQGKAVVVVFWSISCAFCRRHNPHVEKLRAAAVGKPLVVLTVSRDADAAAVARHLREQGLNFAVTLDYAPMAEALSARRVTPLTVTVGRDGRVRQVIAGEMFEEDVLELLQLAG
ncbi:MAG TPA: TlpA disulfide reductase family protein [Rubrivivax sp.]|nr:TlpA disulfide reductase family protein [Rubrivivax sp.]